MGLGKMRVWERWSFEVGECSNSRFMEDLILVIVKIYDLVGMGSLVVR